MDINIIKTVKIYGKLSKEEKTAIDTTFSVLDKFDDIIRSTQSGSISDFIDTYYSTYMDALADLSENEDNFINYLNIYMEK